MDEVVQILSEFRLQSWLMFPCLMEPKTLILYTDNSCMLLSSNLILIKNALL